MAATVCAGRANEQPDVILLDLQMPNVDGFTVLQELNADKRTSIIPVIVSTSLAVDAELKARLPVGTRRHLEESDLARERFAVPSRRDEFTGRLMTTPAQILILNVDDQETERYVKSRQLASGRIQRARSNDRRGGAAAWSSETSPWSSCST